ncbi:MAG: hypothetical protein Q9160_002391 [Pyrenula sp. 1 TL-2023]
MASKDSPPERREPATSHIASFIRWVQLKKYQYEVTFSLYMLTPTEKFIFNAILFILVSMLITAATLYLPNHVVTIYNRVWYYYHGEQGQVLTGTRAAGGPSVIQSADNVMRKLNEL